MSPLMQYVAGWMVVGILAWCLNEDHADTALGAVALFALALAGILVVIGLLWLGYSFGEASK